MGAGDDHGGERFSLTRATRSFYDRQTRKGVLVSKNVYAHVVLGIVACGIGLAMGCGGAEIAPSNDDPLIEITTGPEGAVYGIGLVFDVVAAVSDQEDAVTDLSVIATAGGLSLGTYAPSDEGTVQLSVDTEQLGVGEYTLTLKVVDSADASATATDEFSVVESDAPVVTIVYPTESDTLCSTLETILQAQVDDPDDDDDTLLATWESDLEGTFGEDLPVAADGTLDTAVTFTVPGTHLLTLTVTDPQSVSGVATVEVTVAALDECNEAPVVEILAPEDASGATEGDCVEFTGLVSDDLDAASDLQISWDSHIDHTLGTDPADGKGNVSVTVCTLSADDHIITLRAEDSQNSATQDTIDLEICVDTDGDGQGACAGDCDDGDPGVNGLDVDGDGVDTCNDDCDDSDPNTYPGATEICDGLDNNCDFGLPGEEHDGDGDGMWECQGDCDDTNPNVYDGAPELCDGLDNDCDGTPDNGCVAP